VRSVIITLDRISIQQNYTFFQPFATEKDSIIRGTSLDNETSMEETLSDTQAIMRLKEGDLTGLDALIERYQLRAVRAAYLIVRERPLAEDIVQEAFVQLVRKIHKFDETRPFAPWFLRCVINDALKAAQRQKR
jgi:DNA-directed RNA polymerase specialized sigma subunit